MQTNNIKWFSILINTLSDLSICVKSWHRELKSWNVWICYSHIRICMLNYQQIIKKILPLIVYDDGYFKHKFQHTSKRHKYNLKQFFSSLTFYRISLCPIWTTFHIIVQSFSELILKIGFRKVFFSVLS